jgi:predicted nucleotidyltransferase component of viral defense system
LLDHAKQHGAGFQDILVRYGTERLLYRLSRSRHRDRFLLKGAVLFAAWAGAPHRPSRDADLLGLQVASPEELMGVFRDVVRASTAQDGLEFDARSLRAIEIAEQQDSPGVRLTLRASLDRAVIPLQIDIAFGQAVVPKPEVVQLPTLLDLPAPRLKAYPPEAVVAEKFEAVVKLGMVNSRLKDFYDLWYILTELALPLPQLSAALSATFTRRGTLLPLETPAALTAAFSNDPSRQRQWAGFLDRAGVPGASRPTLDQVTAAIRNRLMPVIRSVRKES